MNVDKKSIEAELSAASSSDIEAENDSVDQFIAEFNAKYPLPAAQVAANPRKSDRNQVEYAASASLDIAKPIDHSEKVVISAQLPLPAPAKASHLKSNPIAPSRDQISRNPPRRKRSRRRTASCADATIDWSPSLRQVPFIFVPCWPPFLLFALSPIKLHSLLPLPLSDRLRKSLLGRGAMP